VVLLTSVSAEFRVSSLLLRDLHLPAWKQVARWLVPLLATCYRPVILLGLFDPEDGGDIFLRNVSWLNGLYGVISQKIVLFITTAIEFILVFYSYAGLVLLLSCFGQWNIFFGNLPSLIPSAWPYFFRALFSRFLVTHKVTSIFP
jgi:hypothetical protein